MYYYYYYFEQETGKVTIDINFKDKNKNPVSLEQLMEFFNAINELHRRVIFLTQPEYEKSANNLAKIEDVSLLSYHQLEIEKIHRENPFFLTVSFRLVADGVMPYWTLWKIFIKICKRYGSNSLNLNKTIIEVFKSMEVISSKIKQLRRDSQISKTIDKNVEESEYDNLNKTTKEKILSALKNPTFNKYYDFLCTSSILITDFFSNFNPEDLNELEDLVDYIKNEKIDFIKDFEEK